MRLVEHQSRRAGKVEQETRFGDKSQDRGGAIGVGSGLWHGTRFPRRGRRFKAAKKDFR
jgi:hypothetical protein